MSTNQHRTKMTKAAQTIFWLERPFCSLFAKTTALGFLLALVACASSHQPQLKAGAHTPNEEVLNQIWAATHTDELFESLPLKMPIKEMIDDRFRGLAPSYQQKIIGLLDKNMESPKLQRMLKSHLLKNFNGEKGKTILEFYRTPLGKVYGTAGHEFDPQTPEFKAFTEKAQPSKKRFEQLAQLLTASGSAKFASITLITPIETIFHELEHQKRLAGQKAHPEPVSALRKSMQSVVKAMHKAMLLTASFVYRDLTDEQMQTLIDFESSSNAKWYNTTLLKAYEKTLQVSMRRFTRQLLTLLKEEPPEPVLP